MYREQRRFADAEAQWRHVIEEQPNFVPAWLGLGELYLTQGHWEGLEHVCHRLEVNPQTAIEGAILRARGYMARKEYGPARQMLGQVIEQAPQALWPRVFLSHCFLQEGKDWAAAEKALHDVLTVDPNNVEARHNLAILLQQQGREV